MAAFGFGPSLDLSARAARRRFDFSGGVLPPGAVLTRASPATQVSSDGLIAVAGPDVARFDHDPATGARRGLLIEPAATNVLSHSANFAEASWGASGVVVTGGMTAPDGSTSAATILDADADYGVLYQSIDGAGGAVVASIYIAKDAVPASVRFPLLRLSPNDLVVDTMTGTPGAGTARGVVDAGTFWRCWVASAEPPATIYVFPAVAAGALTSGYDPTATGAVTLWGAQVEEGSVPSSIVPTASGPATRAADVLTLDWARFGVPDGTASIRYHFDDGTSQIVAATVAAGLATVPTDLARRHLVAAEPA